MDIEKLKQKYAEKFGKDDFMELLGSVGGDIVEMSDMYEGLMEFIKEENHLIHEVHENIYNFFKESIKKNFPKKIGWPFFSFEEKYNTGGEITGEYFGLNIGSGTVCIKLKENEKTN